MTLTKEARGQRMYKMYLMGSSIDEVAEAYNVSNATVYSDFKGLGFALVARQRGRNKDSRVIKQNPDGTWKPIVPMPITFKLIQLMGGGKYGCPECSSKFYRIDSYENHYRGQHA